MRRFTSAAVVTCCIFLSAGFASPCRADERIKLFRSEITVNTDATLDVTETITVTVEGQNIKRGIYRDFPTRYKDRLGNNYVIDFELVRVLRDGAEDATRIEPQSNGLRIYIGSQDYFLPHGEHTYTVTYRTDRQLGFFKDYDELYWNVIGNGWAFSIDKTVAVISLPDDAAAAVISQAAYTGFFGAQGTDFSSTTDHRGDLVFETTRVLGPREGFTVAVSWPKGYVARPDLQKKLSYYLRDNRAVLIVVAGALFVLLYYFLAWYKYGRDPRKGTVIPLFNPPEKLSPYEMRYIMKMGYDNKAFTACVIAMAVKGYLTIAETSGRYTLTRTGKGPEALTDEELGAAHKLFGSSNTLALDNVNHSKISSAINSLRASLRKEFEKTYFLTNNRFFVTGAVMSVLFVLPGIVTQSAQKQFIGIFMTVWLSIWSIGVAALMTQVVSLWKSVLRGGSNKALGLGSAIMLSLFALPFVIGEIVGISAFTYAVTPAVFAMILVLIAVNALFFRLLKAPTMMGRQVMDRIEGFRMFLAAAEKDRMNTMTPPQKTPELFEKYLPYALALDVEQQWSEQFSEVLRRAGQDGRMYHPGWYSGHHWDSMNAAAFGAGLGSSFSSAISAASTAPGSSSGSGGGGSSGGGGGGGGGGGW